MGPAHVHAKAAGLMFPLSLLVIYDTCIQSGPAAVSAMRNRFPEACPANGGDEKAWTRAYIKARESWLQNRTNPLVQRTVYRTQELMAQAKNENWTLALPLKVRGTTIT